jgi:hypothetical protein
VEMPVGSSPLNHAHVNDVYLAWHPVQQKLRWQGSGLLSAAKFSESNLRAMADEQEGQKEGEAERDN